MKTIQLLQLDIQNFKGIEHKTFDFQGNSASIYGDNATGKTTVYDALTWLLFGKDSHGAAKFEFKPLDHDGNVRAAGVMPTITAKMDVDGDEIQLQRVYREKWERKRGSTDKELDGHTTDYFVDEVPKTESEYKRIIGQVIDEKLFQQLTSAFYFCADMPWKKRREQLFELCNVQTDSMILATAPEQFGKLREEVGKHTVAEYKEVLQAQRKKHNQTLNQLPARVDECSKTIEGLSGIDFSMLHKQEESLKAEYQAAQSELVQMENSSAMAGKRAAIDAIRNDIRQLEMDNQQHRRSQEVPFVDERPALQKDVDRYKGLLQETQDRAEKHTGSVKNLEGEIERCRNQWTEIDNRPFTDDGFCKLCGQKLPDNQIAEARSAFEQLKDNDKLDVFKRQERYKDEIAKYEKQLSDLRVEYADYQNCLETAEQKLREYVSPEQQVIEDLPDYQERFAKLMHAISDAEKELDLLRNDSDAARLVVKNKMAETERQLHTIRGQIAAETTLQNTQARLTELNNQQRETAAFLENIDCMIEICEDFTRYKVECITEDVNRRFKTVKFRLFKKQMNGGLEDCCDVTVDGVPYASLNNAAKINAGLDVIAAISEHEGVKVPLFVDNAESVTNLYPLGTQVIRLVVSENDKELRFEV